jgi:hypothetical protein
MRKTAARKSKPNEPAKTRKLTVKRETLKDLTPRGQQVKGGGGLCTGCTRSR